MIFPNSFSNTKKNGLEFTCLFLLSLTYVVDFRVFLFFRIYDFILFVLIIIALIRNSFYINKSQNIGWFFIIFLFLSYGWGTTALPVLNFYNYAFGAKYLFLILYLMITSEIQLDVRMRKILYASLFLSYLLFFINTTIVSINEGFSSRVGFPFTDYFIGRYVNDAHLFSSVVSLISVFFLLQPPDFVYTPNNFFWKFFVLSSGTMMVLLSGSRTGVMVFLVFGLIITIIGIYRFVFKKVKKTQLIFFLLAISLLAIGLFVLSQTELKVLSRVINFSIEDPSFQGRILKGITAIDFVNEHSPFLGVGMQAMKQTWLDNGIASIIVNLGYIGVLFLGLLTLVFLFKASLGLRNSNSLGKIFIFVILALLVNTISEYFLVTRALIPFGIIISLIRNNDSTHILKNV